MRAESRMLRHWSPLEDPRPAMSPPLLMTQPAGSVPILVVVQVPPSDLHTSNTLQGTLVGMASLSIGVS